MNVSDLKIYLPKYLSEESETALVNSIRDFPNISSGSYYSTGLEDQKVIFQGDGISKLLLVNLPSTETKERNCIVLSNTCDLDLANQRYFSSQIVYAPIMPMETYREMLKKRGKNDQQIDNHLRVIRHQEITQIFYLPELTDIIPESIVFLDRVYNIANKYINRNELPERRLFTLSDFGAYLFIFKLSLHFTRIYDKVDRGSN